MFGVLSGLLLNPGAKANVPHAQGYPYQGIVERNIFGLKPPPPPVRPEDVKPPVPKVWLTGITTILGNKRALLKVQIPAKPPQQAKEESYILTEGQSEADIEVLAIDEVAGTVKVDNHGTIQTLDFVNNGIKPAGGSPVPTFSATPVFQQTTPGMGHPPPAAGGMRQISPRPPREAFAPGTEQGSVATVTPNYSAPGVAPGQPITALSFTKELPPGFTAPPDIGMSGEEQSLLIEAQRAKLLEEGKTEDANMLPFTELTPVEGQSLLPQ